MTCHSFPRSWSQWHFCEYSVHLHWMAILLRWHRWFWEWVDAGSAGKMETHSPKEIKQIEKQMQGALHNRNYFGWISNNWGSQCLGLVARSSQGATDSSIHRNEFYFALPRFLDYSFREPSLSNNIYIVSYHNWTVPIPSGGGGVGKFSSVDWSGFRSFLGVDGSGSII